VWTTFHDIELDDEPFAALGGAFEREHPTTVRRGHIGLAEARLFPQRAAVDYAVHWLKASRGTS
jgi:aminoglycoside 3-N-acetyltransferase